MSRNGKEIALLLVAYVAWIVLLRVDAGGELLDTVVSIFGPIPLAVALLALNDPRDSLIGWLRGVLPGLFPGMVAGLMLGLALRLVMRLVALAAGVSPSFTIPGSLTVLLIFMLLGGAYGGLLVAVWRSLPGFRSAPALVGGTGLALWFWYPFFLAAVDDLSGLVSMPLIIFFTTLLAGMWIGYGMLFSALMRRAGSFRAGLLDDASAGAA